MGEQVSNHQILQAVLEMSDQQQKMSERMDSLEKGQRKMSERMDKLEEGQRKISEQITDMEARLSERIDIVGEKIEVISSRLLATEADVRILKRTK